MLPKSNIETMLTDEIVRTLSKLESQKDDPEKYAATLEHLTTLHKLKTDERLKLPSLDTVLIVSANIFGILWLTRFERENIIPSKAALNLVMRPRG